jgi:hypothetical protein
MRQAGELSEHSNESIESLSMSVTRFHGHAKATIGMSPPFWPGVESCNDFVGRRELGELGEDNAQAVRVGPEIGVGDDGQLIVAFSGPFSIHSRVFAPVYPFLTIHLGAPGGRWMYP